MGCIYPGFMRAGVSDMERRVRALRGMGIVKLTETAQREFNRRRGDSLTNIIRRQELSLPALDRDNTKEKNPK